MTITRKTRAEGDAARSVKDADALAQRTGGSGLPCSDLSITGAVFGDPTQDPSAIRKKSVRRAPTKGDDRVEFTTCDRPQAASGELDGQIEASSPAAARPVPSEIPPASGENASRDTPQAERTGPSPGGGGLDAKSLHKVLEAMTERFVRAYLAQGGAEAAAKAETSPVNEMGGGEADHAYRVGYGKPPQETRFQKGSSGNPGGRGKSRPTTWSLFEREFQRLLTVRTRDGGQVQIPTAEALVRAVINEALRGNWRAWDRLKDYLDHPYQEPS